jgi:hypothetical protein
MTVLLHLGARSVDDIDEDMEEQRVDTTELEMLFENYLMQIEWISSEIEEVLDEITNTEGAHLLYDVQQFRA